MDASKAPVQRTRTQAAGLVCNECYYISPDPLPKCSGCRRAVYCGSFCQKRDWKEHKPLCAKLAKVNAYDAAEGHKLVDLRYRLDYEAEQQMNRLAIISTATYYPHVFVRFGIKCQVCFRTPFHDADHQFTPCGECKLAWWCSEDCKNLFKRYHPSDRCAKLGTIRAVDSVHIAFAVHHHTPHSMALYTETPLTAYTPPSTWGGWDGYHTRIMPRFDLLTKHVGAEFAAAHPESVRAVQLIAIDTASPVLTILAALERVFPDLPSRKTLCVHIVGADSREELAIAMMEEILHCLPNLHTLTIIYIGPNLSLNLTDSDAMPFECRHCAASGRRRFALRRAMKYHAFAKTETYKTHPADFVAGFHTGMSEIESASWRASLRVMLDEKVPAVFTAYSPTEAAYDMEFLKELGAEFVQAAERNVWRGKIPHVSEHSEALGLPPATYYNNYWMVVKGAS